MYQAQKEQKRRSSPTTTTTAVSRAAPPATHLPEHLLGECPVEVHHQVEHLIVGAPGEQDFSGDELVEDAAEAPHV
jgi:hypothetical protein